MSAELQNNLNIHLINNVFEFARLADYRIIQVNFSITLRNDER
jgi:hypothetical protein